MVQEDFRESNQQRRLNLLLPMIPLRLPPPVEAKASSADCVGFTRRRRGGESVFETNQRGDYPARQPSRFFVQEPLVAFLREREDRGTEDKKKKTTKRMACAGGDCREQHGGSGKRFSNVEDHGRIEAVIRRQRKGHEQNLGGGDYVPLQRSSARANGKENESKEEEEEEKKIKRIPS